MPSSRKQNLPSSAQEFNQNFGVLRSSFSKEVILVIMVFPWPSHLLIRNIKAPVPLNPAEIKHSQNKTDGDAAYFCINQLVQKNRSSSVLSSVLPGQQAALRRRHAAMWAQHPSPPPRDLRSLQHAGWTLPGLRTPALGSLSQRSFTSDYVPAVPFGAST